MAMMEYAVSTTVGLVRATGICILRCELQLYAVKKGKHQGRSFLAGDRVRGSCGSQPGTSGAYGGNPFVELKLDTAWLRKKKDEKKERKKNFDTLTSHKLQ